MPSKKSAKKATALPLKKATALPAKKAAALPAKKVTVLPAGFKFPAVVAASPTSTTSPARTALIAAAGFDNCVFSGKPMEVSEAAHIFPKCWIEDGKYKILLKNVPKAILEGAENRIMMYAGVHVSFDRGDFGLKVVTKGSGRYRIVVKTVTKERQYVNPQIIAALASEGVVDGKIVTLPWVDERLIVWHWERFTSFKPTAGADDEDSSSDAEYRRRYNPLEDPQQVQRAREMMCEQAARYLP